MAWSTGPIHQGATGACLYLLLRKEEDFLDSDYQAEGVTGRMVVIEVPPAFNSPVLDHVFIIILWSSS